MSGCNPSITGLALSARAAEFLMALIPPTTNIDESIGRATSRTRVMPPFYPMVRGGADGAGRRPPSPAGLRSSGRQSVQVAWEQRHLTDVGCLDQPAGPALEPDRKAAVRGDAVPEGVDIGLVR